MLANYSDFIDQYDYSADTVELWYSLCSAQDKVGYASSFPKIDSFAIKELLKIESNNNLVGLYGKKVST